MMILLEFSGMKGNIIVVQLHMIDIVPKLNRHRVKYNIQYTFIFLKRYQQIICYASSSKSTNVFDK